MSISQQPSKKPIKDNTIVIHIEKPAEEIFAFTINPKNTPLWVEEIVIEETNEWPVKVGSVYRNKKKNGEWVEYEVIKYQHNKMFVFRKNDNNYHVWYSFKPISETITKVIYYEWVDSGVLVEPFSDKSLKKLKYILESTTT